MTYSQDTDGDHKTATLRRLAYTADHLIRAAEEANRATRELSDEELATRVSEGDPHAALALLGRYEPHVSKLAARHGISVAFDRDDVRQEAAIQLVHCATEAVTRGEPFLKTFINSAGNTIADEAAKYRHPVPIPLRTFRYVHDAVKKFDGDAAAAREYLSTVAVYPARVSTETFDAVWLLAFGVHLDWGSSDEVIAEPATTNPFASIEDRDYVRYLLDLLESDKGPQYREVVARMFGLDGHPSALFDPRTGNFIPATSKIVAAEMGLRDDSVRRIWSKARAFLTIHAEEF